MAYKNWWGKEVPSVTDVLGVLAKPALIHWAWSLGMEGKDYREVRDERMNVGTLVHKRILAHLKGEDVSFEGCDASQIELVERSFAKYLEWERQHDMEPIMLEEPIVCDEFGGTVDNYCILDGRKTIIDYKTGKGIYPEYFYQLAGYKLLLNGKGKEVEQLMVLRIGAEDEEGFEAQALDVGCVRAEIAERIFRYCLAIYTLQKKWEEGGLRE